MRVTIYNERFDCVSADGGDRTETAKSGTIAFKEGMERVWPGGTFSEDLLAESEMKCLQAEKQSCYPEEGGLRWVGDFGGHSATEWLAILRERKGEKMRTIIDLSLKNTALYEGCEIEEVAGRLNLKTPVESAINIVGRNVSGIVLAIPPAERNEVEITGPMAVWAYLVVFHAVVHAFGAVYYSDGRGQYLLAKHG